jgi:twitching motility protein PilT
MIPTDGFDPLLVELLTNTVATGCSDLHLTAGREPSVRRDGVLSIVAGTDELTPEDTERMIFSLLDDQHRQSMERDYHTDFSFGINGLGRFRANAYRQRNSYALALRVVPFTIRPLEEIGAPRGAAMLLDRPFGLVLVVGPTGSGKSTTLAAMIDRISETKAVHVLTIEDPVEYLYEHKLAMVNQREVGTDVRSFTDGLRIALREDPDVILLGEMRDLDSIAIALTLAETGHLVFATLHTNDASQALDRIVDVFPPERRDQVQTQLASSLQGVISQRLLPAIHGGRVAAYEVLMATEGVRNLLREGRTHQLRNSIIAGQQDGMQTIEMDLGRLVASGILALEVAAAVSSHPKEIVPPPVTAQPYEALATDRRRVEHAPSRGRGSRNGR